MLPEHVNKLKKVFEEEEYKEKPVLDEQQLIENNAILQRSLKDDLTVKIKYFKNHDYHTVKGKILFIDVLGGVLSMEEIDIRLCDVTSIHIV